MHATQADGLLRLPGQVSQVTSVALDHDRQHAQFSIEPLHAAAFQLITQVYVQCSSICYALQPIIILLRIKHNLVTWQMQVTPKDSMSTMSLQLLCNPLGTDVRASLRHHL